MKYPNHPTQDRIALSTLLTALGDPTRLAIVKQLDHLGERSCGSFGLPISNSTLTHHLKALREAGVIMTRIDGTKRFVSLRRDDLEMRFPGLLLAILNAPRKARVPQSASNL